MNNPKIIVFPSPTKKYNDEFKELTDKYDTFFAEKDKCEFFLSWKHNESHLTNRCHYNYILPNLGKLLNFEYNQDDFNLIKKFDSTNTYDLSYFIPKIDKEFEVHYRADTRKFSYTDLIGYTNYKENAERFYENTAFKEMNPDYHLLFFAPHQCCIIKNLSASNNRKLLISGDSQLIPIVSVLAYYFKEIVYLDKRAGDYQEFFSINPDEYEMFYCVSKYDIKKYTFTNFKKIAPENRIKVAIVGMCKYENHYLREWVEYHKSIGIDKIFLFDNNDIDGEHPENVIKEYVTSNYVTVIDKRGMKSEPNYNLQSYICREGYELASKDYDWIAIIDIDEYITLANIKNIKEFLTNSRFDDYECVRLNWKLYNDSDLLKVENNNYNLRNRFTKWKSHPLGKSIYRANLSGILKEHSLNGHGSKNVNSCDENGNPLKYHDRISIVNENPEYKIAWINHYKTKTIEEFVSIRMFRKDMHKNLQLKTLDNFFSYCKRTKEKEELGESLLKKYNI